MRLVYIWIEKFCNLKQVGFSFLDKYKIKVNPDIEDYYEVSIRKNNIELEKLLFGENISISAIVGNNGVGKSTLLDLIRIILFDKYHISEFKGFSVWECNKEITIYNFSNKKSCKR